MEGNGGQIQGGQGRGGEDEGEGEGGTGEGGVKDLRCRHKYALNGEGVGSERGFGEGAAVVQLGVGIGLSLERYLGLPMGGEGEGVWGEMEREHMCDETFQGKDSQNYSVKCLVHHSIYKFSHRGVCKAPRSRTAVNIVTLYV